MAQRQHDVISASTNEEEDSKRSIQADDKVVLKRQMNLLVCIALIVGTIIGSGIFISPKGVLKASGSVGLSLVIWVLAGILAILGGLSYAELGATFGKSGGDYTYIFEAFGPLLAFLQNWTQYIVVVPAKQAIMCITFANYVVQPIFLDCPPPQLAVTTLAVWCLVSLVAINCRHVKAAMAIQTVMMVAKVIGLSIIVLAGIVQLSKGQTQYLQKGFDNEGGSVFTISLAFYYALFSYAGWSSLNMLTEELENPERNFPIAVVTSQLLILALYVMANVSYLTVMSHHELLQSEAVAVTFANYLFPGFVWVIPVFVALSVYGSLNGCIMSYSRLVFVCARDGYYPTILSMIHVNHLTPVPSLLSLGLLTLVVLVVSEQTGGGVFEIMNYMSFSYWLFVVIVILGQLYMRWKRPQIMRPFKVPIVIPIIFVLVILFLEVTAIIAAPIEACVGLGIILTGLPVYFFGKWKTKPKLFTSVCDSTTMVLQKFLYVVRQEEKTY